MKAKQSFKILNFRLHCKLYCVLIKLFFRNIRGNFMKLLIFMVVIFGFMGTNLNLTLEECCLKLSAAYSAENPSPESPKGENKISPVDEGGNLYFQRCFYCHGPLLDGKGRMARGFKTPPVSFARSGAMGKMSESDLLAKINKKGHKYFIENPLMKEKMIQSVIYFLNSRTEKK